jgi:hypothetical protein
MSTILEVALRSGYISLFIDRRSGWHVSMKQVVEPKGCLDVSILVNGEDDHGGSVVHVELVMVVGHPLLCSDDDLDSLVSKLGH